MQSTTVPSQSKGKPVATCIISGLPIKPGERIRAFLLTREASFIPEQPENPQISSGTDIGFPRTYPVKAICDEYNEIHGIDDNPQQVLKTWVDGFKLDAVSPENRKLFSIEDTIEAVQEGQMIVDNNVGQLPQFLLGSAHFDNTKCGPQRYPSEVHLEMIREDVWQALLRKVCTRNEIHNACLEAQIAWKNYQHFLKGHRLSIDPAYLTDDKPTESAILRNANLYSVGLGTQICLLGLQQDLPTKVSEEFLKVVAAFFCIQRKMLFLGKPWRTCTYIDQPQDPDMQLHAKVLRAFANCIDSVTNNP